jgi:hypothetical protein
MVPRPQAREEKAMTAIFANTVFARMAAAAVVAAGLLSANAAQAYDRGVYVYNDGWDAIYSIHITHIDEDGWGRDLLGRYVIDAGDGFLVEPRNPQGYCRFDVRITYETGEEIYLWDVNLCGGRQIVTDEWNAHVYTV